MPTDELQVVEIVRRAHEAGQRIRVVGTGHSFVPLCATDEILISLDELQGVESTDRDAREATICGGTKIHALGDPLRDAGLALENQGDIDRQSICGAVSTGTHGTGRTLGSFSTQVVGARIVTASCEVVDCTPTAMPDVFPAVQLSLGALGVISAVRLRTKPAYRVHEKLAQVPISDCLARLHEQIEANRHFEFFWYPQTDLAHTKTLNPTDRAPDELPDIEGERIDDSAHIFPSVREVKFNEIEYSLPFAHGPDCFREIRELMRSEYPNVTWPVEYRTQAADEIYLSPAFGRETVAISVHQAAELPCRDFFADAERIFRAYDGRPHWGKMHNLSAAQLRELYPQWDDFQAARRKLDPEGRFLNGYLRRLFGEDL